MFGAFPFGGGWFGGWPVSDAPVVNPPAVPDLVGGGHPRPWRWTAGMTNTEKVIGAFPVALGFVLQMTLARRVGVSVGASPMASREFIHARSMVVGVITAQNPPDQLIESIFDWR